MAILLLNKLVFFGNSENKTPKDTQILQTIFWKKNILLQNFKVLGKKFKKGKSSKKVGDFLIIAYNMKCAFIFNYHQIWLNGLMDNIRATS